MKDTLLSQLRRQLRENPPEPVHQAPKPPPPPAEEEVDDATLFARATRGVNRIHSESPPIGTRPSKPDANILRRRAAAVAEENTSGPISDTAALMHAANPEETLLFARSGVQHRSLQKLKQGQPHWQAAVDLHGCTVEQAREAILQLLKDAVQEGFQSVKIVHGKGLSQGQALLKTYVNGWLRQLPEVLAFASAMPKDGGTGAVYVLLKRPRSQQSNQNN